MARDYTDGHGWSKLDATAAHRLAETMCAMRGRTADKRRDMLLWCYSRLSDGNPPTFRVGARTLAKACGYTYKAARKFLEFMDEEGWFVVTKEAEDGLTDTRTFWWFAEDTAPLEGRTLRPRERSEGRTPCAPEAGPRGAHQMTESSESVNDSVIHAPHPSPAPAAAGPGGADPEKREPFVPPPSPTSVIRFGRTDEPFVPPPAPTPPPIAWESDAR